MNTLANLIVAAFTASRSLRYIARPIGTMGALLTMALALMAVTGWPIHGACGVVALLVLAVRDMKEDA